MPRKRESEVVYIDLDSDDDNQNTSSGINSDSVGKTSDKVENVEIAQTLSSLPLPSVPQIDSDCIEVKRHLRDKVDVPVEKMPDTAGSNLSCNQNQNGCQNFKIKIRNDLTYLTSDLIANDKQNILNKLKISSFKTAKVRKLIKANNLIALPINATMLNVTRASSTVLTTSVTPVTTTTLSTCKADTGTVATTTSSANTKHQYVLQTASGKILTLRSSDIQQLKPANINLSPIKKRMLKILPKFPNNVGGVTAVNQNGVPTAAANMCLLSPTNKFVKLELCKKANKSDMPEVLTIKLSKGKDNKSSDTTAAELK